MRVNNTLVKRMLAKIVVSLFIICFSFPSIGAAQENGVHVVNVPEASNVSVYLILDTSKATDFTDGLAHYAEHLAWNNIAEGVVDNFSQHSNAWTSPFVIGYWLSGPKEKMADNVRILSNVFNPIEVTPNFASEEVGIVQREFDLRLAENVDAQAYEAMGQFLYQGNILATSLLGTREDIRTFTLEEARKYHAQTHRIDNAKLLVTGPVKRKAVHRAVKKAGMKQLLKKDENIFKPVLFELAALEQKKFTFDAKEAESHIVFRKIVKLSEEVDFELLDLQARFLSAVLDTNMPGGIAGPLRYDEFIARSFYIAVSALDEQHIELYFGATPDAGVSLIQLNQSFSNVLATLASEGMPQSTFDRILKRTASYTVDWESKKDVGDWMSQQVLARLRVLREPLSAKKLKKLETQLSLSGVNALLKELQKPGREAVAFIENSKGEKK